MTLEEAIEGLIWLRDEAIFPKNQHDIDTLSLGIEALKQVQFIRGLPTYYYCGKLPGEAKE